MHDARRLRWRRTTGTERCRFPVWDWASQANSVGMNKKNYSQPINAVKVLYFSKFRGKGHKQEEPASDDEE